MEAYKLFKECHKEKVAFSDVAFIEGMDHIQRRVANLYLFIDLRFLDKDEDDQAKGAPTTKAT